MPPVETRRYPAHDLHVVVTAPPYFENCYVVVERATGAQAIIDPGAGAGPILDLVTANGGPVAAILLTHGHPDHIASLAEVQAATGAPVLAHARETPVIEAAPQLGRSLLGMPVALPPEIGFYDDEPRFDLLGGVGVVATPGHTPGGVCYLFDGFALTGDTLFMRGVGRTDFPGGDAAALSASIDRFLAAVPGETELYSGHGPSWAAAEAAAWWKVMGAYML